MARSLSKKRTKLDGIIKKKRYKCPHTYCMRYKFHLHCTDISKPLKKEFHNKMKRMGTLGITRDIWKGTDAIFTMLEPKAKRTYNRRDDWMSHLHTVSDNRWNIDGEHILRDYNERRPTTRSTEQLADGRVIVTERDQYGDMIRRYIENHG